MLPLVLSWRDRGGKSWLVRRELRDSLAAEFVLSQPCEFKLTISCCHTAVRHGDAEQVKRACASFGGRVVR